MVALITLWGRVKFKAGDAPVPFIPPAWMETCTAGDWPHGRKVNLNISPLDTTEQMTVLQFGVMELVQLREPEDSELARWATSGRTVQVSMRELEV